MITPGSGKLPWSLIFYSELLSLKYVDDTNFDVPAPAYNLPGQAPAETHFDLVEHGFPLARE